MYDICLGLKNMRTGETRCKEHVKMYSLWGARCWARKVIQMIDVNFAEIVDEETGEVMLTLNEDGTTAWDSEG